MQTRARRWIFGADGFAVMVFGMLCSNYTRVGGIEHHTAVAAEHGWPAPSPAIARMGMLLAPLGGGLLGYAIGSRRRRQASA